MQIEIGNTLTVEGADYTERLQVVSLNPLLGQRPDGSVVEVPMDIVTEVAP